MTDDSAVFLFARDGGGYTLMGWVDGGAAPHQLGGWPFVAIRDDTYSETMFREDVRGFMYRGPLAGRDWVLPATAEDRTHAELVIGDKHTAWQYVWQKGGVHIYREGYLMAQVFPHGARKHTALPTAPPALEEVDA